MRSLTSCLRAHRLLQHLTPHTTPLIAHRAQPSLTAVASSCFRSPRTAPSLLHSSAVMSSDSTPIYEQSAKAMKAYLDSYGVDYKDCVEKHELVQRVKDTLANPPPKPEPKKVEGLVGPAIVKLLGEKLQAKSGKFSTAKLQAKVVALYFSAHWCGPCRSFTPALRQLYIDTLKKQGIEVVFVSSDQDDNSFDNYYSDMPWLALPFEEREIKDDLSQMFRIQGIPSLIVLNAATGRVISNDGRSDVMNHRGAVGSHWLKSV